MSAVGTGPARFVTKRRAVSIALVRSGEACRTGGFVRSLSPFVPNSAKDGISPSLGGAYKSRTRSNSRRRKNRMSRSSVSRSLAISVSSARTNSALIALSIDWRDDITFPRMAKRSALCGVWRVAMVASRPERHGPDRGEYQSPKPGRSGDCRCGCGTAGCQEARRAKYPHQGATLVRLAHRRNVPSPWRARCLIAFVITSVPTPASGSIGWSM
jgi:hypothetical protein